MQNKITVPVPEPRKGSALVEHPYQPLYLDECDVIRFKENQIVNYLLTICRENDLCNLNKIAFLPFLLEDRIQFNQLIGYSLAGWSEYDMITDQMYNKARNNFNFTKFGLKKSRSNIVNWLKENISSIFVWLLKKINQEEE